MILLKQLPFTKIAFCGVSKASQYHPVEHLRVEIKTFHTDFLPIIVFCPPVIHFVSASVSPCMAIVLVLFVLIFYVPVNSFSVLSGRVFFSVKSTKQRINVLLKDTKKCLN